MKQNMAEISSAKQESLKGMYNKNIWDVTGDTPFGSSHLDNMLNQNFRGVGEGVEHLEAMGYTNLLNLQNKVKENENEIFSVERNINRNTGNIDEFNNLSREDQLDLINQSTYAVGDRNEWVENYNKDKKEKHHLDYNSAMEILEGKKKKGRKYDAASQFIDDYHSHFSKQYLDYFGNKINENELKLENIKKSIKLNQEEQQNIRPGIEEKLNIYFNELVDADDTGDGDVAVAKHGGSLPKLIGGGYDFSNPSTSSYSGGNSNMTFDQGLDYLQTGLSTAGLTPGYGIFADVPNALISGARAGWSWLTGDDDAKKKHLENLALNTASAVPGPTGWTAGGASLVKDAATYSGIREDQSLYSDVEGLVNPTVNYSILNDSAKRDPIVPNVSTVPTAKYGSSLPKAQNGIFDILSRNQDVGVLTGVQDPAWKTGLGDVIGGLSDWMFGPSYKESIYRDPTYNPQRMNYNPYATIEEINEELYSRDAGPIYRSGYPQIWDPKLIYNDYTREGGLRGEYGYIPQAVRGTKDDPIHNAILEGDLNILEYQNNMLLAPKYRETLRIEVRENLKNDASFNRLNENEKTQAVEDHVQKILDDRFKSIRNVIWGTRKENEEGSAGTYHYTYDNDNPYHVIANDPDASYSVAIHEGQHAMTMGNRGLTNHAFDTYKDAKWMNPREFMKLQYEGIIPKELNYQQAFGKGNYLGDPTEMAARRDQTMWWLAAEGIYDHSGRIDGVPNKYTLDIDKQIRKLIEKGRVPYYVRHFYGTDEMINMGPKIGDQWNKKVSPEDMYEIWNTIAMEEEIGDDLGIEIEKVRYGKEIPLPKAQSKGEIDLNLLNLGDCTGGGCRDTGNTSVGLSGFTGLEGSNEENALIQAGLKGNIGVRSPSNIGFDLSGEGGYQTNLKNLLSGNVDASPFYGGKINVGYKDRPLYMGYKQYPGTNVGAFGQYDSGTGLSAGIEGGFGPLNLQGGYNFATKSPFFGGKLTFNLKDGGSLPKAQFGYLKNPVAWMPTNQDQLENRAGVMPGLGELVDLKGLYESTSEGDLLGMGLSGLGLSLPFIPGKWLKNLVGGKKYKNKKDLEFINKKVDEDLANLSAEELAYNTYAPLYLGEVDPFIPYKPPVGPMRYSHTQITEGIPKHVEEIVENVDDVVGGTKTLHPDITDHDFDDLINTTDVNLPNVPSNVSVKNVENILDKVENIIPMSKSNPELWKKFIEFKKRGKRDGGSLPKAQMWNSEVDDITTEDLYNANAQTWDANTDVTGGVYGNQGHSSYTDGTGTNTSNQQFVPEPFIAGVNGTWGVDTSASAITNAISDQALPSGTPYDPDWEGEDLTRDFQMFEDAYGADNLEILKRNLQGEANFVPDDTTVTTDTTDTTDTTPTDDELFNKELTDFTDDEEKKLKKDNRRSFKDRLEAGYNKMRRFMDSKGMQIATKTAKNIVNIAFSY